MMTTQPPTPIQKFDGSGTPTELKAMRRWAPWKAVFNPKRGKWDKIPMNAKTPEYGISTASPEKWFSHDEALKAYIGAKGMLAGICFVVTGIEGTVGVDLDNCLDEHGVVAPWAQEIIAALNSYTEISPSGRGLRIFIMGNMDGSDWTNHEVGIEVYGGSTPRHLTVSGRSLHHPPKAMAPVAPGVLSGLRGMYGRASRVEQRKDIPPAPDVLAEMETPVLSELDLPLAVVDFLKYGENNGDRSRSLHSAAVALFSAGLAPQEVLSVLVNNPHALEVGLDHRRQDIDRATAYLWEHHCVKAQPKARTRAMTALEFDDMTATIDVPDDSDDDSAGVSPLSDFEDVSSVHTPSGATPPAPAKKQRFQIHTVSGYASNVKRLEWFIKGVLPKAELSALFGESGSGKTFLALDMVCRVALGLDWFGIPTRQSKILYVAAEGASGMRDRTQAWCMAHGHPLDALDGWLYILGDQPNLLEKDDVKALVLAARAACPGVALVVLDTMAQVTPGANENSGEDMGRFLGHAKAIGRALGAHVAMVGHSGKNSDKGLRGWSGIKGALDAECEVIRTKDYRAMVVTKLKDGAGEGREYRFKLDNVLLDFDLEDGDVTSCVVAQGDMLDESGARDAAAIERKEKAKTNRARPLSKRQAAVVEYLRNAGGPIFDLNTVVASIVAHLTDTGKDGVAFTSGVVEKGQAGHLLVSDTFPGLEKKGLIRTENGKLVFLEGVVTTPNAQELQV